MITDRIVVTGLGVISPFGVGVDALWNNITSANLAISKIESFNTSLYARDFGGEVKNFEPNKFIDNLNVDKLPRTTQLAVSVAKMAIKNAGLESNIDKLKVGVSFGTTMGNQSVVEQRNDDLEQKNEHNYFSMHEISRLISDELGLFGPLMVLPNACAAGNYAIAWGYDLIKNNHADIVIVGGSDAMSRGCYAIFNRLNAIAKEKCQPFDKNRTGMIVSEGAACFILEKESVARRRGATILAEMLGYGLASDSYHMTAPHPEGLGLKSAIENCLSRLPVDQREISYISAHGTGTKANDAAESASLKGYFGAQINHIPVSSVKSMLGHTMGGASAIGAVICIKSILHNLVPPTANYSNFDEECLTNVVPNKAIYHDVLRALNIGIGFGGNIAVTVFGKLT